jgi:protein-S-isoprenylcysteine O-methyltransferase Ste14
MSPQDDDLWRNRFVTVNLTRIGGTAVVLFGLGIWYTNVLVPGGSIALGLPLALVGLVASFWGPVALSRHWKRKDGR